MEDLKKLKANPNCKLVFPTAGCNPRLDFLDHCKAITQPAGLPETDFCFTSSVRLLQRGGYGAASTLKR